jgi:hypothetical protein
VGLLTQRLELHLAARHVGTQRDSRASAPSFASAQLRGGAPISISRSLSATRVVSTETARPDASAAVVLGRDVSRRAQILATGEGRGLLGLVARDARPWPCDTSLRAPRPAGGASRGRRAAASCAACFSSNSEPLVSPPRPARASCPRAPRWRRRARPGAPSAPRSRAAGRRPRRQHGSASSS